MKPRILIVEDEIIAAKSLKDLLEDWEFQVSSIVTSGEAAVEKAGAERPDVVLMDVNLAGEMDGIEAAGRIISEFGLSVIFISASSDPEVIKRANSVKPAGYLLKPLDFTELLKTINSVL